MTLGTKGPAAVPICLSILLSLVQACGSLTALSLVRESASGGTGKLDAGASLSARVACDAAGCGIPCRDEDLLLAGGPDGGGVPPARMPPPGGAGSGRVPRLSGARVPSGAAADVPGELPAEVSPSVGPANLRPTPGGPAASQTSASSTFRFRRGLADVGSERPYGQWLKPFVGCVIPNAEVNAASSHPIMRLVERTQGGQGWSIQVTPFETPASLGARLGDKLNAFLGESIQSVFLARFVRAFFPNARLVTYAQSQAMRPGPDGRKLAKVFIRDDAEISNLDSAPHEQRAAKALATRQTLDALVREKEATFLAIQMALLKAVNMSASGVSRTAARTVLGLPPSSRVAHVYSNIPYESLDLVALVAIQRPTDVLFFTPRQAAYAQIRGGIQGLPSYLKSYLPNGWRVVTLSQATPKDLAAGHVAVVNDMNGMMAYLNAASNIYFVLGPINPLEGLAAGTPTIVVATPSARMQYNADAYRYLVDVAIGTGGAQVVQSVGEAIPASVSLEERLAQSKAGIRPPYASVVDKDGTTALTRFLDSLQRLLESQGM